MKTTQNLISQYFNRPIFFITPDTLMALGLIDVLPDYHIITSYPHPIHNNLRANGTKVYVTPNPAPNSESLLSDTSVIQYIKDNCILGISPIIISFKPSPKIEKITKEQGFVLAAGNVHVNRVFEDKIAFYQKYAGHQVITLPPGFVCNADDLYAKDYTFPIVIQTGRGWAGNSTMIAYNQEQLAEHLQHKKNSTLKCTQYIKGQTLTLNAVVSDDQVVTSPIAGQILPPTPDFASNEASTCGRYWQKQSFIDEQTSSTIKHQTQVIAQDLLSAGYRGFFGCDFLLSEDNTVYLLEVNPRLTASESFYTRLQLQQQEVPLMLMHLMATLGIPYTQTPQIDPVQGIQIVMRNTAPNPISISTSYAHTTNFPDFIGQVPWKSQITQQLTIITQPEGIALSPNHEIFRVETTQQLTREHGQFVPSFINHLTALKNKLIA